MKNNGNFFEHKGYLGTVEYSAADKILFGKVLGVKSLILYEGDSLEVLRKDFEECIDDYLEYCEENGLTPEKPFQGSINVTIDEDLHRKAINIASSKGITLNALVEQALRQTVN